MDTERAVNGKLVLFHGLDQDEAIKAMRAIKAALASQEGVAFAMTTESNLSWPVAELIEHVLEEHAAMTGRPSA